MTDRLITGYVEHSEVEKDIQIVRLESRIKRSEVNLCKQAARLSALKVAVIILLIIIGLMGAKQIIDANRLNQNINELYQFVSESTRRLPLQYRP